MTTKQVQWAYPTSAHAQIFGFAFVGCWVVQTVDGIKAPKAIAGYARREDAMKHAATLPHEWNQAFLKFNPLP